MALGLPMMHWRYLARLVKKVYESESNHAHSELFGGAQPSQKMTERICWTLAAWEDYQYWQGQDRKTLRRINLLLQDCLRNPHSGLGKPEPLRENLSGYWSRRIDDVI